MLRQSCTESVSYIQTNTQHMQYVTLRRTRNRWQGEQHAASQYKIVLDQQGGGFMKDRGKNKKKGNK